MRLITWNIQWGKGCDGRVDLPRIVSVARQLADADVFCFQEVSDNLATLDGGEDQSAVLARLLPEHRPVFRPAIETVDSEGQTHRFGNMTLSRLPVLQVASHLLPWPGASSVKSMRRQALDVTVQTAFGPLRTVNTHLEFHSDAQRQAQITRLLDLQEEASSSPVAAKREHTEPYGAQTLAASSILCGDFNFDVSNPQHALLQKAQRPGLNYRDAWTALHGTGPRATTCGIFDRTQWSNGPDCRDFIFVTEDLRDRILRVEVDTTTDASDHQPVLIELAD